ncbi:MAG: hypothetical protein UW30_C0010G0012 [Candidatus Giovannonibacteria bacterium GW2011_GWA2_44_13b]|uniref:General secretion pathway protein G n=2 Tax=Candidatus Giovannoniibacteriota TaxID=1752738 RepID=A0A0G1H1L1_9BACT|nr:MAG: hypothetical protein UW30_C0010G0012 [Candidatus Giovannonibacteria bacterium GW2011_GWA2_44_13b]OGF83087.1 MAG: hypothetical protein A2924_02180 [Candidatus Giovannonibacteria bacterium RIFCSPLOWO2_01_FULL_44_16]
MKILKTNKKGFSLIELLVVLSIIGILANLALISVRSAREKAFVARVKADQSQLRTVILQLESDTAKVPNYPTISTCTNNLIPTVLLDTSGSVGLAATDGNFPNWNGPYMSGIPNDSWYTPYYFDVWRVCNGQVGCEGIADGTTVRAIVSFGPNKVEEEAVGSDDIVTVICR